MKVLTLGFFFDIINEKQTYIVHILVHFWVCYSSCKGLDNYIGNYDNILLLGDFNLEFSEPCLNDFCDINNLKNLVKEPTCFKNPDNPSCIDLFLTNRQELFSVPPPSKQAWWSQV